LISLTVKGGGEVLSHPVEGNSFASYNKISGPLNINVSLGFGGSEPRQEEALSQLEKMRHEALLVAFSSPSAYYPSLTLQSYDYERTREKGSHLLICNLHLLEVREAESLNVYGFSLKQCLNPSSVSLKNIGKAQVSPWGGLN
ncbi:MAG: phage baseplate protein, partial [Candidatus Adiutrix sp.]